ncbi:hypothetical protein AVEN_152066-1, partial [Araneus ventricosus]
KSHKIPNKQLFCVLTNDIWAYQWSAKLNDNNTVFQAELTALHEAVIYASHLPNHNTSKIHVDNRASIMASSNSKSTSETARKNFKILLSNPRIKVSWVKAHAGNIGNERADQLAKDATQHGQPYSHTKLPKPHIKSLLRKRMLEEWQTSWKNGDTGRKIYNIMSSVSLRPTDWTREDVIFFSQHPFSLPTSKGFTCLTAITAVVVELARHFTIPRSVFIQCLGI